jgi:hypothetical protein
MILSFELFSVGKTACLNLHWIGFTEFFKVFVSLVIIRYSLDGISIFSILTRLVASSIHNTAMEKLFAESELYNSIHSGFPDNGLGMNSLIMICEFTINGNKKTMMIFIKKATS